AGVIVHEDADLDYALSRIVAGGFGFAGQSCISVQRIFVHRPIWESFRDKVIERAGKLVVGDPSSETTDIGPLINEAGAVKAESWIREATDGGAKLAVGGARHDSFIDPTVVLDAKPDMKVSAQEVFAPLVGMAPYDDFDDAVKQVDASEFGLQA